MVFVMQASKLYIDFGDHPGKDRIPREAVSCGCLLLTNKRGSAAFHEDIPIDEKYKVDEPFDYERISETVKSMLENYAQNFSDFEEYRNFIKSEKVFFEEDVKVFIQFIESTYGIGEGRA